MTLYRKEEEDVLRIKSVIRGDAWGGRLRPHLWEPFRAELQRIFRRGTGEPEATLLLQLTIDAPCPCCGAKVARSEEPAAPPVDTDVAALAELVLSMSMATERGRHARHMARMIIGICDEVDDQRTSLAHPEGE